MYFNIIYNYIIVKTLYKTNQLTKIGSESLDDLKYAYNIMVIEYFKQELKPTQNPGNGKGVVIDVTEE